MNPPVGSVCTHGHKRETSISPTQHTIDTRRNARSDFGAAPRHNPPFNISVADLSSSLAFIQQTRVRELISEPFTQSAKKRTKITTL
jgi:hypothetical protein